MLGLLVAAGGEARASRYNLVTLADPTGQGGAWVSGINASGQVVGYLTTRSFDGTTEAVVWSKTGALSNVLPGAGGGFDVAYGINDSGTIVGRTVSSTYDEYAVLWTPSSTGPVKQYLANYAAASGINNAGAVVGYSYDTTAMGDRATIWTSPTSATQLPGLGSYAEASNSAGVVVGNIQVNGNRAAAKWTNGALGYLATPSGTASGSWSFACGINDSGYIAGFSTLGSTASQALLWAPDGSVTTLQDVGGQNNSATSCSQNAINSAGAVVGMTATSNGATDAVLWSSSGVGTDLASILGSDWSNTRAVGINDRGDIAGLGTKNGKTVGFLLVDVPEPAAWALLLMGVVGVAGLQRRRVRDGAAG